MFSTYFANIGARFLIPCLPFFSLAIGLAFGEAAPFLAALMVFHAAASWPPVLNRYVNPNCWRLVRFPYQAALRITPPDEFLRKNSLWIRRRADDRSQGAGRRAGFQHGRRSGFLHHARDPGVASNPPATRLWPIRSTWAGTPRSAADPRESVFNFRNAKPGACACCRRRRPCYPEQWNVHELRFFYHGAELARKLDWRLRAWPNPWEVQTGFRQFSGHALAIGRGRRPGNVSGRRFRTGRIGG